MEDADDLFAIKNCIIPDSQEEKLRSCRYAGASPEHSDSVSSSPARTPSEQPAIFMASPPGSGSVDQNTPRKNDASRIPPARATSSSEPYPPGSEYPRPYATTAAVDDIGLSRPQNVSDHLHIEVIDLESEEDGDEEECCVQESNGGGGAGKRKLPWSMRSCENRVRAEEGVKRVDIKNGSFKDLMETVQVVFGKASDGGEKVSLLETAERQGWKFPRPRWWPPEGFDD